MRRFGVEISERRRFVSISSTSSSRYRRINPIVSGRYFLAVRKLVRGLLGPVQSRLKVSDVVGHSALIDPSCAECRAG